MSFRLDRPSDSPDATFPRSPVFGIEIVPDTIVDPDLILPNEKS